MVFTCQCQFGGRAERLGAPVHEVLARNQLQLGNNRFGLHSL